MKKAGNEAKNLIKIGRKENKKTRMHCMKAYCPQN